MCPRLSPTNEPPACPVSRPRPQKLPGSSCPTCGPSRKCRASSDRCGPHASPALPLCEPSPLDREGGRGDGGEQVCRELVTSGTQMVAVCPLAARVRQEHAGDLSRGQQPQELHLPLLREGCLSGISLQVRLGAPQGGGWGQDSRPSSLSRSRTQGPGPSSPGTRTKPSVWLTKGTAV